MMNTLALIITAAGLDALVDAQNGDTDAIKIVEVGLSQQAFDAAPTLEVLPGEFKRIGSVSGQSVAENVIHMTAQDVSPETYDLRGLGLYLEDGTLFAAYGQNDPLFRKVSIATFLLAFDVAFSGGVPSDITFGDASFLYPPATEIVRGVARLATQARVDAEDDGGDDSETIVTPKTLRSRLAAFFTAVQDQIETFTSAVNAALDALRARTITGGGLVSGGGDLTADRVLSVLGASGAEALAEQLDGKALTPATLAGFARQVGQNGYAVIPGTGGLMIQHGRFIAPTNGSIFVTWPIAFPNACYSAVCSSSLTDAAMQDNYIQFRAETITPTGATAYNGQISHQASFIAIGR